MKFRVNEQRKNKTLVFSDLLESIREEIPDNGSYELVLLHESWSSIVGELLSVHSEPYSIGKSCTILVEHPAYSNDIQFMKERIIERCSTVLHRPVSDIKILTKKNGKR